MTRRLFIRPVVVVQPRLQLRGNPPVISDPRRAPQWAHIRPQYRGGGILTPPVGFHYRHVMHPNDAAVANAIASRRSANPVHKQLIIPRSPFCNFAYLDIDGCETPPDYDCRAHVSFFYRATHCKGATYCGPVSICPSVCLSVRLRQVGILPKRLNV